MNNKEIILKGKAQIDNMEFNHIEGGFGENEKSMLAKDIADIHGRELKDINRNINSNINRFKEGVDIVDLKNGDFNSPLEELGFSNRDISISNNIYLLSERGYAKLLKILEDDFAWEQYDKLVDGYFQNRKALKELSDLSPELQLLINIEIKQKEQNIAIEENKKEIQDMRDVVSLDTTTWRNDTAGLINRMAKKIGGYEHIKAIREESYELLNKRMGVALSTRLTNKKRRMALEGASKSSIDKLNNLDVIAEDKKLIEGYTAIVKEMSIKYGIA